MPRATKTDPIKKLLKNMEFDNQHTVSTSGGYIDAFVAQGNPNGFKTDKTPKGITEGDSFDPFDFKLYSILGTDYGIPISYFACIDFGPNASQHIEISNNDDSATPISLDQLRAIRFESLSEEDKELYELIVLDNDLEEVDYLTVKVSEEFVKRFKSLEAYTWKQVDIDFDTDDGLYMLQPGSIGHGEEDDVYSSEGADATACAEIDSCGAWFLDQRV